ncbi:MAG: response regulator [Bacteroidetes bacterium]|nr:response regulator [Bacteroidota bacterium]
MSGQRIIIVNDEVDFVKMLVSNLEIYGYKPEGCTTPRQVLNRIKKSTYDMVLVDFKMPKMNGGKLIKEIQAIDQACKFIILTGFSVEGEIREIMETNPNVRACLQKPFDMQNLVDEIENNFRN